jgi:hypothetical protein
MLSVFRRPAPRQLSLLTSAPALFLTVIAVACDDTKATPSSVSGPSDIQLLAPPPAPVASIFDRVQSVGSLKSLSAADHKLLDDYVASAAKAPKFGDAATAAAGASCTVTGIRDCGSCKYPGTTATLRYVETTCGVKCSPCR